MAWPPRRGGSPGCRAGGGLYGVLMAVKLALVVRADLGMGRGKIAAQVAHAAVAAVLATARSPDFAAWLAEGQPKVVLKVSTAEQLLDVAGRAHAAGLPVELIQDAGRTQVAPGTATCCAIGPADSARMDPVTAELALL
jgi:peptidyl-tRNA hydrolase, PTH2 family